MLLTLGPFLIIVLVSWSQYQEAGFASPGWALAAMVLGAILYFPIRCYFKPGVPDVDPFRPGPEED